MAYLEANGIAVVDGALSLPAVGRAVAELRLASPAAEEAIRKGGAVTLTFQDGTTYEMGCLRAGEERGLLRVRLAAGKGKLGAVIPPKFYEGAPATVVFKDVLSEAGELAGDLDLPGTLPAWARREGPAFEAIRAFFIEYPTRAWRVMPDGRVWAGVPTWEAGPEVRIVERDPGRARYVLGHLPSLQPGVTLEGIGQVDRVIQHIGKRLRTEVYGREA